MRCKKHLDDFSSQIGVCASCLRQRLFSIMVAQAEEARKGTDNKESPYIPSSVSPYDSDRRRYHQRFFSTPQVIGGAADMAAIEIRAREEKRRGAKSRLSSLILRVLFRLKSDKVDPDPNRVSDSPQLRAAASPSWFSKRLKKKYKDSRTFSADQRSITARNKPSHYRHRGMSPARNSNEEDNEHWIQTPPRRTPADRRRDCGKAPVHVTEMSFCLSPLIRPSPGRLRNHKGLSPDISASCELRPRFSSATQLRKNRSRKLADFGRHNNNHVDN